MCAQKFAMIVTELRYTITPHCTTISTRAYADTTWYFYDTIVL